MFEDREGAVAIRNSSDRPEWHEESFSRDDTSSDFRARSQAESLGKAERAALPVPIVRRAADGGSADAGAKSAHATTPRRGIAGKAALAAALVAALTVGGWYGQHWWTFGRFIISTDDAYVGAKNTTLAAKVSGYLSAIKVEDNARVRAGDIIATIDDGDYRLAVDAARDKISTQQASVERIGKQVLAQQASVDQAKAQLASAQAVATRTESELERQQALGGRGFASQQTLEQARANRDQAVASIQSSQAAIAAASATVDVLKGQQEEASRTVAELTTSLRKAERDLSFTVIRAPFDGVIGNRAVQTGDYIQPGQRLASVVPLDAVYVDANFKETQLAKLRPGQVVSISVDAAPDSRIDGTVESVAPASGSVFSLLPPDNATGNFTKVVQRVPVRIRVPAEVAEQGILRPGMSVIVGVNTKSPAIETKNTLASAK